ncbi:nocturnin-like isoform X2 [Tachypleus tridentatus]|uniref:nocturnin-like isoform X2 n=1 Tax=Tachypleus tridentatus TaxID=6853 RepID=UPI003FD25017
MAAFISSKWRPQTVHFHHDNLIHQCLSSRWRRGKSTRQQKSNVSTFVGFLHSQCLNVLQIFCFHVSRDTVFEEEVFMRSSGKTDAKDHFPIQNLSKTEPDITTPTIFYSCEEDISWDDTVDDMHSFTDKTQLHPLTSTPRKPLFLSERTEQMPEAVMDFAACLRFLFRLFRMGSFTSAPKILNEDTADYDVDIPERSNREELLKRCDVELKRLPPPIRRSFHDVRGPRGFFQEIQHCKPQTIRVMQWNILSQSLGEKHDNFVACPQEALCWKTRRWRMLEEIFMYKADILCFQEVDHFYFLQKTLGALGFVGTFFPKPDSPCCYVRGNNGPDGCAIFYNTNKYELLRTETRILEVCTCQSNQVAILCIFRRKADSREFCITTTHLKARQGTLLATLRNEQGKDLLDFIRMYYDRKPLIVTGDFNAEPTEPVYNTMTKCLEPSLDSGYSYLSNRHEEHPYTTWTIREDGEICRTLDYIFFNKNTLTLESVLNLPREEDIGEDRVPSFRYSSDHFSLVCDFCFK